MHKYINISYSDGDYLVIWSFCDNFLLLVFHVACEYFPEFHI